MRRHLAALAVLPLAITGCGGEDTAGTQPTTASSASQTTQTTQASQASASAATPTAQPSAAKPAGDLCKLFSAAEIARGLGVGVGTPKGSTLQGTSTCVWPAAKAGDGAATVVRGPAAVYDVYKPDFSGPGGPGKPTRHDLAGYGDKAHVIGTDGDSLGGRWAAIAVRGDQAFAVDITGVKVREAGATGLLRQLLDRS